MPSLFKAMPKLFKFFVFSLLSVSNASVYAMPSWFVEVVSEQGIISEVGMGESLEQAKSEALSNIARMLHSEVSSSLQNTLSTMQGEAQQHTQSSIHIDSDALSLPTVQWTHSAHENGVFYVRGKISLSQWVALSEQQLESELLRLQFLLNKTQWSALDLRDSYALDSERLAQLKAMLAPYSPLPAKAQNMLSALQARQLHYMQSQCFRVEKNHDRIAERYFKPVVESALHHAKLSLDSAAHCHSVRFMVRNDQLSAGQLRTHLQLDVAGHASSTFMVEAEGSSYSARLMAAASLLEAKMHAQGILH